MVSSKYALHRHTGMILGIVLTAATCAHPATISRPSFGGGGAPAEFVASTSDARTTRVISVREGLTHAAVFRIASDVLAQHFTVDVSDPNSGFLMTPWQATFARNGVPELRYRTRVVVRFLGDEWGDLAVRVEANWQRGDEWQVGYDEKLLDQVVADLTSRLGVDSAKKKP